MEKQYKIDGDIYSNEIINDAISSFSWVADIKYENNMISISASNTSEVEEIFNEFMNYCIHLINEI